MYSRWRVLVLSASARLVVWHHKYIHALYASLNYVLNREDSSRMLPVGIDSIQSVPNRCYTLIHRLCAHLLYYIYLRVILRTKISFSGKWKGALKEFICIFYMCKVWILRNLNLLIFSQECFFVVCCHKNLKKKHFTDKITFLT